MGENKQAAVHIGEINLRIPGKSPESGHRIANRIARSIAREIRTGKQVRLGLLSARIPTSSIGDSEISTEVETAVKRLVGRLS